MSRAIQERKPDVQAGVRRGVLGLNEVELVTQDLASLNATSFLELLKGREAVLVPRNADGSR